MDENIIKTNKQKAKTNNRLLFLDEENPGENTSRRLTGLMITARRLA